MRHALVDVITLLIEVFQQIDEDEFGIMTHLPKRRLHDLGCKALVR